MPPRRREQSPASARKRSGRSTLIACWASICIRPGCEVDYFHFPTGKDAEICHRRYVLQQLPDAANQRGDPTRQCRGHQGSSRTIMTIVAELDEKEEFVNEKNEF
ncbi:hypothetical protein ACOME3_001036 [Neoechinorhynchus agilis]